MTTKKLTASSTTKMPCVMNAAYDLGAEGTARRLVLVGTTGDASAPGHDALARESGQDIVLGKPMPERLPAELLALLG